MANITIAPPGTAQREAVLALLPRLAQFALPPRRVPEHLWATDAQMLQRWYAGDAANVHVYIAATPTDPVAGLAMFSLREELLSHAPSAHLEALAVSQASEGRGIGSALLDHAHARARELGAASMTLHVFAANERARRVYARAGYEEELLRCIHWFDDERKPDNE